LSVVKYGIRPADEGAKYGNGVGAGVCHAGVCHRSTLSCSRDIGRWLSTDATKERPYRNLWSDCIAG
jgi:hypothetical protein